MMPVTGTCEPVLVLGSELCESTMKYHTSCGLVSQGSGFTQKLMQSECSCKWSIGLHCPLKLLTKVAVMFSHRSLLTLLLCSLKSVL